MKKIFLIVAAIAIAISFSATASGVEKKEKKADDKKQQTAVTKDQKKALTSSSPLKKYDSFIDNNKNGIDDRSENLKPKKDINPTKTLVTKKSDKKPLVSPPKNELKKEESKEKKPN